MMPQIELKIKRALGLFSQDNSKQMFVNILKFKSFFILCILFSILYISTSYSQETNEKSSINKEIYSTTTKKYSIGIEGSGEILGFGSVIELYPQEKFVLGLAIGTGVEYISGNVRLRYYTKIDKSSIFWGVGYSGFLTVKQESVWPNNVQWSFLNIGHRLIFKSNHAFSINFGAFCPINNPGKYLCYPGGGIEYLGIENLWR